MTSVRVIGLAVLCSLLVSGCAKKAPQVVRADPAPAVPEPPPPPPPPTPFTDCANASSCCAVMKVVSVLRLCLAPPRRSTNGNEIIWESWVNSAFPKSLTSVTAWLEPLTDTAESPSTGLPIACGVRSGRVAEPVVPSFAVRSSDTTRPRYCRMTCPNRRVPYAHECRSTT